MTTVVEEPTMPPRTRQTATLLELRQLVVEYGVGARPARSEEHTSELQSH